ncbi:hypothetical protein LTR98_002908 [Exophiala xenobiotica]|nr:hypothetical protein LTR98_002908 [Exophiala xenobiotica]
MSPTPTTPDLPRYACTLCARRKVKCDKSSPCSNCLKAHAQCLYEPPASHRPRKRPADDHLLARLATYEDLMRKHKVDFSHYDTWIPSGLEVKQKESEVQSPASIFFATSHSTKTCPSENIAANLERCLWSDLSTELKYPPIQTLRHKDDPFLHPTPSLSAIFSSNQPELYKLHPEPRHIYRCWQIFVECVNPLTKIVHVPTLQQRILDATWDTANVSRPLTAMLFAIYTQAITSMSSDECLDTFGETRDDLLTRYRVATIRALMEADFLTTRDFEVLQAFVLFLLANPDSELTSTLTAAAIRLGQKMGLDRENNDPEVSFFEKEMRVRLWWRLLGLDSRSHAVTKPPLSELNDVRPPLNVNDADLHPNMVAAPVEHNGPTEMLCILMKYEVSNWLRSSPTAAKVFGSIFQGSTKGDTSMQLQDDAVNELEAIYQEKFLRKCDRRIPLHALTYAMAKRGIARMRFKVHHPRARAAVNGGEVYTTREESDMLFESAVTSLEMVDVAIHSKLSSHLFAHMTTSKFQMDAYIYVISELRRRCSGYRVALTWKLVEDLFDEHPELIDDTENTFFAALGDLTLEAWESRRKELVQTQGVREIILTPRCIQLLWDKRQKGQELNVQLPTVLDPPGFDAIQWIDDRDVPWDYWNEFLQL